MGWEKKDSGCCRELELRLDDNRGFIDHVTSILCLRWADALVRCALQCVAGEMRFIPRHVQEDPEARLAWQG